jgi:hypothetical protein
MAGDIILEEKGWLGDKKKVLCSDEGAIYRISLTSDYLAWANDTVIQTGLCSSCIDSFMIGCQTL